MSSDGAIWTMRIHKADPNFLGLKHNSWCNLHVIFQHFACGFFGPDLSMKKFF